MNRKNSHLNCCCFKGEQSNLKMLGFYSYFIISNYIIITLNIIEPALLSSHFLQAEAKSSSFCYSLFVSASFLCSSFSFYFHLTSNRCLLLHQSTCNYFISQDSSNSFGILSTSTLLASFRNLKYSFEA